MNESTTPVDNLREAAEEIIKALEIDAEVAIDEEPEQVNITIDGDELGLVIGRRGQTIDAIEHILQRIAYPGNSPDWKRVVLDAAGYREKRRNQLERTADHSATRAVRYGRPVALDAMRAGERKIVHLHLADRSDIETYSEGREPHRHVVISPSQHERDVSRFT